MNTEQENYIKLCLAPTDVIDSDNPVIIEKARSMVEGCSDDREKAVRLFYFVRDSIRYNLFMISAFREDFTASRILEWGKGYCVQKAVLLTALARSQGIPARLAFAEIKNHCIPEHVLKKTRNNVFPRHGYNQFFLDGRWINAAATFDRDMCEKNGLPVVEFDGMHDSELPEKDLQGRPYIEYLQRFEPVVDLPFEWIREKLVARMGPEKRPWLTRADEPQN